MMYHIYEPLYSLLPVLTKLISILGLFCQDILRNVFILILYMLLNSIVIILQVLLIDVKCF